jgi:hypothetical protein
LRVSENRVLRGNGEGENCTVRRLLICNINKYGGVGQINYNMLDVAYSTVGDEKCV